MGDRSKLDVQRDAGAAVGIRDGRFREGVDDRLLGLLEAQAGLGCADGSAIAPAASAPLAMSDRRDSRNGDITPLPGSERSEPMPESIPPGARRT